MVQRYKRSARVTSLIWKRDVWLRFQISEVTLTRPQDEDGNFYAVIWYLYILYLYWYFALYICIAIVSLFSYFVLCAQASTNK